MGDDWDDWGGGTTSDQGGNKPETSSTKKSDDWDTGGSDGWGSSKPNGGGTDSWGGDGGGNKSDGWGSGGGGGGGGGGGRSCYNCGDSGHMSRDCPAPKKQGGGDRSCYNCGGSGHMSRDCPEPRKQGGGGGGGGGRSCYNCGDSGHISRDCPAPEKQGGPGGGGGGGGGRSCYNCGDPSHLSRDCTAPKKQGGASGGGGGNRSDSWGGGGGSDNNKSDGWGGGGSKPNNKSDSWGGGGGGIDSNKTDSWGGDEGGGSGNKSDSWGGGGGNQSNDRGGKGSDSWGGNANDSGPKEGAGGDGEGERPAPYRPDELNLDEEAKLQVDTVGENFKRYKDQKVTCIPIDIVKPIDKFEDVIESKLLLENVKNLRYTEMTPIQKWAMPVIIGGYDLIGCAQTGSGKTAAFLLPILQTIMKTDLGEKEPDENCQNPHCIIISPTRELAKQIYTQSCVLSKDSLVKSCYIYGQISTGHLKAQLSKGCHILVATLGRLKDFVQRGWIGFKNTKYIILDEGDRLVDEGFTGDLKAIFEHETMPPKAERQTLFFSATFKRKVQLTAKEYLKDDFIFITVGRVGAANEDIKQEFLQVNRADKKRELRTILKEVPDTDKTIIFTQTKVAADMLAGFFNSLKLSATSIHGDRHQSQREEAINLFRRGDKRFLISSPVGNRGLDLPKVSLVINYDLPDSIDEYVHRIGRTGRAGHTGRAISFFDQDRDREVLPDLLKILKEANQEIPSWLSEIECPAEDQSGFGDLNTAAAASSSGGEDWGSSSNTQPVASTSTNGGKQSNSEIEDEWGNSTNVEPSTSNDSSNKRQATDEAGGQPKKATLATIDDPEW